jgi:hypothetical protein
MLLYQYILFSLGFIASTHAAFVKDKSSDQATSPASSPGISRSRKHVEWKHFDCGTTIHHGAHDFKNRVKDLHVNRQKHHGAPGARQRHHSLQSRASDPIQVDAYVHIVSTADKASQFTDDMVTQQVATLNRAYAPVHVQFTLRNTSWTTNDVWAVGASDADDAAMKRALRQGDYAALNLYFQSDLAGSVLGRCSLPSGIGGGEASAYVADGCNVQAGTLPDGYVVGYNEGMTAVHETGHWLGLLHTFEGYSCDGDGDFIADTPMEATSTDGCPTAPLKNSCPDQSGGDPIHNYMDYSTDACYEGFTDGQIERIHDMWAEYRSGK